MLEEFGSSGTEASEKSDGREQSLATTLRELGASISYEKLTDDAGRVIPCDLVVRTDNPAAAIKKVVEAGYKVINIGARSSATNNFGESLPHAGKTGIVGIEAKGLAVAKQPVNHKELLRSDEIRFSEDGKNVEVGIGVTADQLNNAIAAHLDPTYFVPIDLTSSRSARLGGVAATGAQGPSRIRITEILKSITVSHGHGEMRITDKTEIEKHIGMRGATGAVVQMELDILKRPQKRFGYFVALQNATAQNYGQKVAACLAILQNAFQLDFRDGMLKSGEPGVVLDGAEEVDVDALERFLDPKIVKGDADVAGLAQNMKDWLAQSGSSKGIYLTGYADSDDNALELMCRLDELSTNYISDPNKVVIDLDMVREITTLEAAKKLRETFPESARSNAKPKNIHDRVFSLSTDNNATVETEGLSIEQIQEAYSQILAAYIAFEDGINALNRKYNPDDVSIANDGEKSDPKKIDIRMDSYGHFNPKGIDPHRRVTVRVAEDVDQQVFENIKREVHAIHKQLMITLADLPKQNPHIRVTPGEKGKLTEDAAIALGEEGRAHIAKILAKAPAAFDTNVPKWAKAKQTVPQAGHVSQTTHAVHAA